MNLSGKVLVVTGSDGALRQALASLADELKDRGITVNAVLPSIQSRAVTGALIPVMGRV